MSELLLDRAGRRRSPATMPGFHAGRAPGDEGVATRPTREGRRDHRRHARCRLGNARPPAARTDRGSVARRAADPGGARSRRGRSRSTPRRAPGQARPGRAPSRGRHGRLGSERLQPWLDLRRELPVGPLLCVINGTTRGRHWNPARLAPSCGAPPPRQERGAASRHTSPATPTPPRWPAKASRPS
jgi:hypothetical protein